MSRQIQIELITPDSLRTFAFIDEMTATAASCACANGAALPLHTGLSMTTTTTTTTMTVFRNDAARKVMDASYERFRAHIPDTRGQVVRTRCGDTHVLVAGRPEAPPLLLIHGALTMSAHMLSACTPLLDHFRVYAPDIIGQSVKSADAKLSYDGPDCGEWLVDVLDGLGLARAHVYGASLGGFMARKLAEHAPDRIDRMVLLVPAGIVKGSMWAVFAKLAFPFLMYRIFPNHNRLRRLLRSLMTTLDDAAWLDYFGEALRSYRLDARMPPLASPESLTRFTRPTLVFGASDDIFFPGQKLLARAKVLFPQAETELLECRHMPATDSFSGARVVQFLNAPDAPVSINQPRHARLAERAVELRTIPASEVGSHVVRAL